MHLFAERVYGFGTITKCEKQGRAIITTARIYSNKRRIWDKKVNKHRTPDALTADIFALVIMELSGFFRLVNFSRNSRFTISVVSVHRKMKR